MEQVLLPSSSSPHVLIFPIPAVGHVNSMLKLAQLLSHAGIRITFITTEYYYDILTRHSSDVFSRYMQIPGFQFKTIPDGLPMDDPRDGDNFVELNESLRSVAPPLLKEIVTDSMSPVNCLITDGYMSTTVDMARQVGTPIIYFRTISACAFWAFHCVPEIIHAGELPTKGNQDMDRLIKNVPGMEGFLRFRDLPSFCRAENPMDPVLQLCTRETRLSSRADGLILNTFEDLEGPILSQIRNHCPNIYSIGPLNAHLKARIPENTHSSNGFWEMDRSCMAWLDKQPNKSVIYVSFGSIVQVSRGELIEFYYGIVNSNKHFLWVIRPDSLAGKDGAENQIPEELVKATKERGYVAGWVPQEEVLAHKAVGGFLTHCGWNSTLESIVAGIPMICWPSFADQQINSRFVDHVWKLGLDMKDLCDRKIVEKMVNDLMEVRKEEFMESADRMANLVRKNVNEGGSSYSNLERLINDVKTMSLQQQNQNC